MSLKRYAIIAAVSYHNSHLHNSTAVTPASAAAATTTSATSSSLTPLQQLAPQSSIITAKTSLFSSTSGYGIAYSSNSGSGNYYNNNASSALPGYYGGLSLFHQQNIRSGSGTNNNNGATYPTAINSNVNLLLGGAMLSLVTTILCVVCYCCHRSIRKRTEAAYRQQRQWLESDPNMEIYSVEQCYETSGLFMGESTDGLSTVPTLHHEPPPSYDTVVLMQEQQLLYQQQQQQQQQLLQQQQRTSPPPGYRSTLDVTAIVAAATSATTLPALYVATDGVSYLNNHHGQTNNNNNINSCSNSCDNISSDNQDNVVPFTHNDLTKISSTSRHASNPANPILSMKKVWNAQSCCSLQRAEVENMWNAAAAALAARAGHAENTQHSMTNLMTRKSLPTAAAAALSTTAITAATDTISPTSNGRFGRRYLKHSYYKRGCPLCGKFRYDADDGSLSLSIESNLDQPMASIYNNNYNSSSNNSNKDSTQAARVAFCHESEGNPDNAAISAQQRGDADDCNNNSCNNVAAAPPHVADEDECSCSISTNTTTTAAGDAMRNNGERETAKEVEDDADVDDENGNMYAGAADLNAFYQAADDADIASGSNGSNAQHMRSSSRKKSTFPTEALATTAAEAQNESVELVDLDSINENGIVRLDMSKIIDRTGLPTYEAALKLDSSGYV